MLKSIIQSHYTLIVSTYVVFLCIGLFPVYRMLNFHKRYRTGLAKCPECLGKYMCNCFLDNRFKLNWDHLWTNLLNILLEKNIIFGSCEGKNVVLKWIEAEPNLAAVRPLPFFNETLDIETIVQALQSLVNSNHMETSGEAVVLCPSSEKIGYLLKPIMDERRCIPRVEFFTNLLYSMKFNKEAIVQQYMLSYPDIFKLDIGLTGLFSVEVTSFQPNNFYQNIGFNERDRLVMDGTLLTMLVEKYLGPVMITGDWAVARYLGACGDISVSEYCGSTLTYVFPELAWEKRSSIAKQLIQFALNATFDNPAFAFYFTDMSADNFAVSHDNVIRLVDLDNVIIVDKNPSDMPNDWNTVHTSYHDDNIRGFAFSTEEICSHRISDMNIYSICQGILSEESDLLPGGLLHSAPHHLSTLKKLVEDCISPPVGQSRFDCAQAILKVLDDRLDS